MKPEAPASTKIKPVTYDCCITNLPALNVKAVTSLLTDVIACLAQPVWRRTKLSHLGVILGGVSGSEEAILGGLGANQVATDNQPVVKQKLFYCKTCLMDPFLLYTKFKVSSTSIR